MSESLESITRLTKDLRDAAITLSDDEARFLVDAYYAMQENRKRTDNQVRALNTSGEPHAVIAWLAEQDGTLEKQVARALKAYVEHRGPAAAWCLRQVGIGPIITAGLFAHIDIEKAPTAGHIWNFAGLNPGVKWEKGCKRPWNASLKTLCWKVGESFVKVSGNEDAFYGQMFVQRKRDEVAKNRSGQLADKAADALQAKKFGDDTEALVWYTGCLDAAAVEKYYEAPAESRQGLVKKLAGAPGSGFRMLPPAHIHARAKRWVVKLFLSHLHHHMHVEKFGKEPPVPYAIAHLGHAHLIVPPP
jgi:hypothetical protein